jgi:glycerol kinase
MQSDIGKQMSTLKVDGGASANNFLMQFQSDISNIDVVRPKVTEATAQGAAFLAGLAVGFFKDRDELKSIIGKNDVFVSKIDNIKRTELVEGWNRAIGACKKA